jgi:hypothetical protein
MRGLILWAAALALAAAVPFGTPSASERAPSNEAFNAWPTDFEGAALVQVPLTAKEQIFYETFPGEVARFTDGERQFILRWVPESTRRLHPAAVCFQGRGYDWEALPTSIDATGTRWGMAIATRNGEALQVRELIRGANGQSWSDVAAWHWEASLGRGTGPYLSILVASAL